MAPARATVEAQGDIDAFIDALWLEDGLSANTLAAYRRDLTMYAAWLGKHSGALRSTSELDLQRYFSERHGETKATSANRRLTVFKRYFHWALREGMIAVDPTLKLQSAKQALRSQDFDGGPGRGAAGSDTAHVFGCEGSRDAGTDVCQRFACE